MQNNGKENKRQSKFGAVMKNIFVHNIGWKVLAVVSAAVLWALAAGLY
ncbi:MAG: hypothetical protein J1G01_04760 [Clostridiales bacterium]|nr:hypothetical protein [Clostridiales bacterium]